MRDKNKKTINILSKSISNHKGGENKMARTKKYSVHVGRVGTSLKEVEVEAGTTVEEAIQEAGLRIKDTEQVRVNAEVMDLEDEVSDNDVILLVRNVEGGRN